MNSSVGVDMFSCACAVCAVSASAASPCSRTAVALLSDADVVHAQASPLHDARNSTACTGQRPTGRRGTKGGVSGRAEDLRPVSEVEAGVYFRAAGRGRWQVVVLASGRRPGPGTRWSRVVR